MNTRADEGLTLRSKFRLQAYRINAHHSVGEFPPYLKVLDRGSLDPLQMLDQPHLLLAARLQLRTLHLLLDARLKHSSVQGEKSGRKKPSLPLTEFRQFWELVGRCWPATAATYYPGRMAEPMYIERQLLYYFIYIGRNIQNLCQREFFTDLTCHPVGKGYGDSLTGDPHFTTPNS